MSAKCPWSDPNSPYQWPVLYASQPRPVGNGFYRTDWEAGTSPNPPWEDVQFEFIVPAGAVMVLDDVHIATECIPEPGSVALMLVGLGGFAARCYLRRKGG